MLKILMIIILLIFLNNVSYANEYVIFSICSDASTDYLENKNNTQAFFGHHSWLAITNTNKNSINVNSIELKPYETITIGTWQGGIHNGIFYNVERYYYDKGEFSLEKSAYKMKVLNDFEINYLKLIITNNLNDTWSITNNCAAFSEKVWNDLSRIRFGNKMKISAGIIKTPIKLYENILKEDGKRGLIMPSARLGLYYGGKKVTAFEL